MELFGEMLKRLRLEQGIGLRKFAEQINMKPSHLISIEHDRRKPTNYEVRLMELELNHLLQNKYAFNQFRKAEKMIQLLGLIRTQAERL